jgi:uncharacterized protein YqgV (UPF0045/DUF77 family)
MFCYGKNPDIPYRIGAFMIIQAELSLYLAGSNDISSHIEKFCNEIRIKGFVVSTGQSSSVVSGECSSLMAAIAKATEDIANRGKFVINCKIINI